MSIKKRAAALVTAVMMACSLAGCADTSYVMTADGENINAGIYLDYMFSSMQQQIYMWQYTGVTENFFDQQVGEQSFADYLLTTAMDQTKHYAAVEKLFKESGLKISSEDMKSINNSISDSWENISELYEKEGISKDSLKKIYVNSKKEEMLFDYYYSTDGKEAVSKEDLVKYMNDNYLRFKGITIYKSSNEDETQKEAEDKANQELFEKYKEKAEGVKFADFDALIDEYNEETAPAEEDTEGDLTDEGTDESTQTDESATTDESSAGDESTAADDTSSEGESSADDESSSEEVIEDSVSTYEAEASDDEGSINEITIDENGAVTGLPETESEDYENAADDIDEDIEEADEAEEEADPYVNERLVNYSALDDETLETDYGKRLKEIKDAENDAIITYEDDNAFYIISKGDITERTSEYLDDETNFDTILHEAKDEDFESKIKAAEESISFVENKDAIDRYTPKTMYDRYNDYTTKNSAG